MDSERWQRIQELFDGALNYDAEQRKAFLDQGCADDIKLREEVESLITSDLQDDPLLDAPPLTISEVFRTEQNVDHNVGEKISRYLVQRVIGAGGMGIVYEAIQDQPRRSVALKLMRQGIRSQSGLRRFQYEAEIMGRLQHPGIAQVYEAGTHRTDQGSVPFFAMEYVSDAQALLSYATQQGLGLRQKLDLFALVCDAIQYGHMKGVIHRDLKPANILVDSSGQPKVIDFGIARATEADLEVTRYETQIGWFLGTVQYMSPEQCDPEVQDVDVRSDVYSLGVVLYELLTGVLPYDASSTSLLQATCVIRETLPKPLSSIDPCLKGDVETIVLKALEKNRDQRYQSIAELSGDIRRFLHGEPIQARSPTTMYQLRLLARRHRALFVSASTILIALIVATFISLWYAKEAATERDNSKRSEYMMTLAATQAAIQRFDMSDAAARLGEAEQSELSHGGSSWEVQFLSSQLDRSIDKVNAPGYVKKIAVNSDGSLIAVISGVTNTDQLSVWPIRCTEGFSTFGTSTYGLSPRKDGKEFYSATFWNSILAVGSWDGTMLMWDWHHLGEPEVYEICEGMQLHDIAFRPDGEVLAAACSHGDSGTITLWNRSRKEITDSFKAHTRQINSVAFSEDGSILASCSHDVTIRIWDVSDIYESKLLAILRGHRDHVKDISFDHFGRLVSASLDKTIKIWDIERSINEYAAIGDDAPGVQLESLVGHREGVTSVAVDPINMRLASTSLDNTCRLWTVREDSVISDWEQTSTWHVPDRRELGILQGHTSWVEAAQFDPHGQWIVSGGADGFLRLWAPDPVQHVLTLEGHMSSVIAISFHPDGRWLASGGDGRIFLWDTHAGKEQERLLGHLGPVCEIIFLPDGQRLVTTSRDGTVKLWAFNENGVEKLTQIRVLESHEQDTPVLALSENGYKLATVRVDRNVVVHDLSTASFSISSLIPVDERITALEFLDEDGQWLAAGGVKQMGSKERGWISVYRTDNGNAPAFQIHEVLPGVRCLTASVQRSLLATGCADGSIILWKVLDHGKLNREHVLRAHRAAVNAVAFHPAQQRLASASDDQTIRIWDLDTGQELLVLRDHTGHVEDVEFDPSGSRLVSCSSGKYGTDNSVKIWETEPAKTIMKRLVASTSE